MHPFRTSLFCAHGGALFPLGDALQAGQKHPTEGAPRTASKTSLGMEISGLLVWIQFRKKVRVGGGPEWSIPDVGFSFSQILITV